MYLKKTDYVIISIICFFLGIFLITQYYSGKEYLKVIQPENNASLALEVAKLTKTNADLRVDVKKLTADLETYRSSSKSNQEVYDKFLNDKNRYSYIVGEIPVTGQGIVMSIKGEMTTPELVDLVNAIKNVGYSFISINSQRLMVDSDLGKFAHQDKYEIVIIGNGSLIKSAIERKGGIIDQLASKNLIINIEKVAEASIPVGNPLEFKYAKIITN